MRKTRFLYLVALLLTVAMGAKAGGIAMTTADIGKVLCTDGSIYETKNDVPYDKTAAAMIAYVDEQNHEGLAIALEDAPYVYESNGYTYYKSQFQWDKAADVVTAWSADKAVADATWKLPTIDEWSQMLIGCGGAQNLTGINAKLTAAGYSELNGYYWSSSDYYAEVSSGTLHLAEYVSSDGISRMLATSDASVRACLSFDVEEPAQITEGLKVTDADIGKVVCTDGSIYATRSDADNAGKTAVAMIAYVDGKTGLAIAREDVYTPYTNFSWNDVGEAIALWVSNRSFTLEKDYLSWSLPTMKQWQQMLIGCGAAGMVSDNTTSLSFAEMDSKLQAAGLEELSVSSFRNYYWSGTESDNDNAWVLKDQDNDKVLDFSTLYKENDILIRACISFPIASTAPEAMSLEVTEADLGKVVCTDGSLYDTQSEAWYYGKTPAGMIAFVDLAQQTGLAIAFDDEPNAMGFTAAKLAAAAHEPVLNGTKWKLPTKDDWKLMLEDINPGQGLQFSSAQLNSWLTAAEGATLKDYGDYWTSTETEMEYNNEVSQWVSYASFSDGVASFFEINATDKDYNSYYVRACFPFNVAVKKYPITIDSYYASYVQSNKTEAAEGETVGLTVTPPAGKYVNYISVSYYDNGTNSVIVSRSIYDESAWTFTMPAYPVNVDYVDFQDIPTTCEYNGLYYTLDYIDRSAEVAPHPSHAYSGNINIPRLVLDNKGITYFVTGIGSNAFAGYSNGEISSVTCGSGTGSAITVIRRDAFYNTTLQSLTLNEGLTTIEQYAFRESNMPVEIPTSVSNISTWAFKGFKGTHLSVKSGNATYDSRDNCNAIIETANNTIVAGCITTTIPTSVTTIGTQAFDGVGLTTFNIPANITTLEYGAFANNPLTSITIPKTVQEMETNPFFGCNQLQSIVVEEGNPTFDSREDCNAIINTKMNWLWTSCKNTVIPTSVTGIGTSAFAYRDDLNEYRVPKHIKTIADNAFSYSSLWNISIEDNNELYLYQMAFQSCKNLRTVKIGRGIKELTKDIFRGCTSLKSIYVNAPLVPKAVQETFEADDAGNLITATVYVPSTSVNTYKKANFWKNLNIEAASGLQGVNATFGKISPSSGTSPVRRASDEGVDLITEEGTAWHASGAQASAFDMGSYSGQSCLAISTAQTVSISNRADMGFAISGPVRDVAVWAAGRMGTMTCEIIDIAADADNTVADQTVTVTPEESTWKEYTFDFSGKEYSKAKVKLTIENPTQAYLYSINIIQKGGDYVITDEASVTVAGLEYSTTLTAPDDEEHAEAVVDGDPVYVYTTCLPTAPEQQEGLKFYTLSSSTEELLQFVEIEGAPQANTPYLVAVSSDSELSMSIGENQSVTLKKEADHSENIGAYKFVGTTTGLTNAEAAAQNAYILQDGNWWGKVTTEEYEAYIPPFRAYIVANNPAVAPQMMRGGFGSRTPVTTAVGMQLTDRNGNTRYFDLNGRPITRPATKGVYVTNGKKVLIKK